MPEYATADLQSETTTVLQNLIRFNTVNPPGNEQPAIDYLDRLLRENGFETEQLVKEPGRPNLIATLHGDADGPTLVFLGHVDTVLAQAEDWIHDPWSGEIADGYLWGRGAIDMKNQVAAEAVAAIHLARSGWRPAQGTLKLVFVPDEETGGHCGARFLTDEHPEKVRCDYLFNEGAGSPFEHDGQKYYGVCCGEKGVFRFELTAHGQAGHASMPRLGDNALLKLAPVLEHLKQGSSGYDPTEAPLKMLTALGQDSSDPAEAIRKLGEINPLLPIILEPMLTVTLTPTMAHASDKVNVIPARASLRVDTRVPPGLGREVALKRLHEVLGETAAGLEIAFTDEQPGYSSPAESRLMDVITEWLGEHDPGAIAVPVLLPGYSDSNRFRAVFPDVIAYGFFPHMYQPMLETVPLMHNANERIDVRDLGYAAQFYADAAVALLG
jgi:acetylornithine deacetylase/succinyl-diaminopimelate desuccinylase-like protein